MAYIFFPNPTPIFPTLPPLTWSIHKKTIESSRVTTATTGRETQLACAVYPRWEFTLSYGGGNSWLREQTQNIVVDTALAGKVELEQLSGLFLACRGSYGEFYYTDPDDSSRSAQLVGYGDTATTTFPLFFSWGSGPFTPAFRSPVGGISFLDAVYFNGVVQSPSLYTLDATNTQIVFSPAPGRGISITADFHFYYRCRWADDNLDFSEWGLNLWENKETRFESVKP